MGVTEGELGEARGSRSGGGFCKVLDQAGRDNSQSIGRMVGDQREQILRVAETVWSTQQAQWADTTIFLADTMGEGSDLGLPD